jgi:hypothetical protein
MNPIRGGLPTTKLEPFPKSIDRSRFPLYVKASRKITHQSDAGPQCSRPLVLDEAQQTVAEPALGESPAHQAMHLK